jgi:hypothetical protein
MVADTVTFKSGSKVDLTRAEGIPDGVWNEMKTFIRDNEKVVQQHPDMVKFVCENPGHVKMLSDFANNSEAIKGFLSAQFMVQHVASSKDEQEKIKELENDPELRPIFEDIKKMGPAGLQKYYSDEGLMLKISAKLGGLAPFKEQLETLARTPVTIHEAARLGQVDKVKEYLQKGESVDKRDYKGVTALGYAVGCNQAGAVKILLDAGASTVVDEQANTALHFAAGYGRSQILDLLLQGRMNKQVSPVNKQGQTPLSVAEQNGQAQCAEALRKKGGK